MRERKPVGPPTEIAATLPSVGQIVEAVNSRTRMIDQRLYRAAYASEWVLPNQVKTPYRFGPPRSAIAADGTMPFQWWYVALDATTAVWEAQFCQNDGSRVGTFYMDHAAVNNGVLAGLDFPRPLRLWDLNGEASSVLGVYDLLSSPDYEWCQWFGGRLHEATMMMDEVQRPDGVLYPSRRHRGHAAIIVPFGVLDELRTSITVCVERFAETDTFRRLYDDPLRVDPPLSSDFGID